MKERINDFIKQYYSENTRKNYLSILHKFNQWCGGEFPTEGMWVGEWKKFLINQGLCAKSVNQGLIVVGRFYEYVTGGKIHFDRLKQTPAKVEFLSTNDLRLLIGVSDKIMIGVIKFMIDSGVRLSELVEISNRDIIGEIPKEWVIIGKGSKQRLVMISNDTVSCLENIRVGEKMFGRRLTGRYLQRKLRKLGELAGIRKNIHPHMLRHTSATISLWNGADITDVQKMLGHSNVATTQIYAHVTDDRLRVVWNKCFENRGEVGK